ncbi:hypothetical protein LWI29_005311 [Acer saccharum]|uniref:Exportin-1 C-terminal domain-containing protein n=1 Tax=Acer saccharum TaxID=4024 RepID=A0AA39S7L3_ACESA|nr:hypothetical protein LWI29_005311 [Acer saccharum]KAK1565056.1 hypothetical protein Q3G72_017806 [Acer saccharum]
MTEPLWDVSTISYPYPNNAMFVREYTIKLLGTSFPNMTATEVTQFVNGLFESRNDLSTFKNHIRDFLVQSKEFLAQIHSIGGSISSFGGGLSTSLCRFSLHKNLAAENLRGGLSMPGNEVGDRIHNFFGQENLSQGQHHSQVVDGTWSGLNNNLWVGSQRQIGAPLISNLKNYSVQQSADSDRGHGGQSSSLQHGLNFTQSASKPELARSQSQNRQPSLNGYMHGHQSIQTRQNESNFLGVDTEYNRHNLTSRGLPVLDPQLGNGPEHNKKNPVRLESTESPVNYDFFGGQQQMSNQHPGMLQSLPRQQSGISDMQLLQQQVMLRKLQELQRQQQLHNPQFQQHEARQQNSINQVSSVKQATGSHTSAHINGIPMQDASNYSWQPELMAANANWLQRGSPPVMQVSTSGLMFSPDQGQIRMMGLVPQQVDQSLYGVPITSTRTNSSQHSPIHMDKSTMLQVSAGSNSFPGNQYAAFTDQVSIQDGTMVSRQGYQGKNIFGGQGLNSGLNLENLQQMNAQQKGVSMQEFHERQEFVSPSETSQEKTAMQVAPSQNAAALDPEEEKILFGSDDNVWEAFGRSTNMGSGCSNMLDGTDLFGALPSIQSGSWSALMQSAVAEASSGDTVIQEGWSGLSVRNSEPSTANQQPSYVNDGSKQPSAWTDNNLQTVSALSSRPFPLSVDANTNMNYSSVSGVQQSGLKTSHEQNEKLQNDSSQRFAQQFSGEGNRWLDYSTIQKPVAEGSHFYGNVAHPPETELNVKGVSASWNHQESMSSYITSGQPSNRPNGWNFIDSVSLGGGAPSKNQGDENSLQPTHSGDHRSAMHEKMGHGTGIWKTNSVSNATEHASSAIGHSQVNKEDSDLNNAAAVSDSSAITANQKSIQQLPTHNLNFWKNVNSSVNPRVNEVPGKHLHHLDKSPQIIESSGNNGPNNGEIELETENFNIKEKSSDSLRSNVSHITSPAGLRENVWLDANDPCTFPGGKQKSSGQVGRKPFGTRKFQYHPMGDVEIDTEPSYGIKSVTHSQATPQQVSRGLSGYDQVYNGQSKYFGHIAKNSMENDKVHLPGFQGDMKHMDGVPSKGMHPGSTPVTSAPYDRSVDNFAKNKTASSSQNMLELLHKVDQSKEHGYATPFSSSDRNQSEMPEAETSDGSVGHLQHQSSASQGFGLQLGPPSQRMSLPDHALSFKSSSQAVNSLSSAHIGSEMGKKGHNTWLASTASDQSLNPSHETSQADSRNKISSNVGQIGDKSLQYNIQGSFSAGFPYPRSQLQNQQMSGADGQVTKSQSVNVSFDRLASQSKQIDDSSERLHTSELASSSETSQPCDNNQNYVRGSAQPFPVLEAMPVSQPSTPGLSQQGSVSKMLPNAWASVPNQQNSAVVQASPNLFKSYPQSTNYLEKPSSGPLKLDDQIAQKGDNGSSGFATYSANIQGSVGKEQAMKEQQVLPESDATQKMGAAHLLGKESVVNRLSDASLSNSTTAQRDIEAFGRSLKPKNLQHNYSLLHQMQAMKSTEADPDNRSVKRFKGPECGLDAQHVSLAGLQHLSSGPNAMVTDASANSLPPGDSTMLSFSAKSGDNHETNAFGHNDSQNPINDSSAVVVRGENSQISPQMAPSWFDQYGNFKNGQMLPTYDARKAAAMKTMEQPFVVGKSSDGLQVGQSAKPNVVADASQLLNVQQSPISLATEHLSSPPAITNQSLILARPNKRKAATSKLLPWHREVMQGFQKLQNISMAEMEWAQAANRLMEKVEDETELIEDGQSMLRSKRRLVLTTQLMQQLFRPPSAKVLTSLASAHHESVTYFVARSALGDACSSMSSSRSDTSLHPDSGYLLSGKLQTSERIGNQYISKAMEDFIDRAKKLEDDLLRLDKRASILDLRVECQDLEKFSVINRFAKFHGRGQADGAETSSSSDVSANSQKFFPQRYVTALPMPRNLPDRVQCLSL